MDELKAAKVTVLSVYESASDETREALENIFGADKFVPSQIRTYEDACRKLGIAPTRIEKFAFLGIEANHHYAYHKLTVIARALNDEWTPDWKNDDENKYYPWFDFSSGRGLSYGAYVSDYSYSHVGSRLCFKSRELAIYAGKQFTSIYADFMTFQ